jgi:hypothetical protein
MVNPVAVVDVDTIGNVNAASTSVTMNGDYCIIATFAYFVG